MSYCLVETLQFQQKAGRQSLRSSQVAHQAGAYPGFCSMKCLGVFLLPSLDGMLAHRGVNPAFKFIHLFGD